jgi:hypothetical protein
MKIKKNTKFTSVVKTTKFILFEEMSYELKHVLKLFLTYALAKQLIKLVDFCLEA